VVSVTRRLYTAALVRSADPSGIESSGPGPRTREKDEAQHGPRGRSSFLFRRFRFPGSPRRFMPSIVSCAGPPSRDLAPEVHVTLNGRKTARRT